MISAYFQVFSYFFTNFPAPLFCRLLLLLSAASSSGVRSPNIPDENLHLHEANENVHIHKDVSYDLRVMSPASFQTAPSRVNIIYYRLVIPDCQIYTLYKLLHKDTCDRCYCSAKHHSHDNLWYCMPHLFPQRFFIQWLLSFRLIPLCKTI